MISIKMNRAGGIEIGGLTVESAREMVQNLGGDEGVIVRHEIGKIAERKARVAKRELASSKPAKPSRK